MAFELHPRLAGGTFQLGRESNCVILLKNNAAFPWILIVPEVDSDIEDLHELSEEQYREVFALIRKVSLFTRQHFSPEKLNVGCIGNIVRQMHIHIVGRTSDDPAWPGTVWASSEKRAYAETDVLHIQQAWTAFTT